MKVLAISNLFPPDMIGGYELGCSQAVQALRERGHDVEVLTSAPRTPVACEHQVRRSLKLADVYNVQSLGAAAPVTRRLLYAESSFLSAYNVHVLTTALDDVQPDAVYLWNLVGLGGLGLVGCLHHLRVPWVWHLMDPVPLVLSSMDGNLVPAVAREFERQIEGSYLACSQRVFDEIADGGLHLRGDCQVVPNWIRGRRGPARTHYFDGSHLRIVFAGQVARHKGIDILIESAALLRRQGYANFSIDIFGELADPSLHGLARAHDLEGCIRFKGFQSPSRLASVYKHYDVFAFPTWRREPFAFAPIEAAAHGCLSVMTDDCGNAEWFVDGVDCVKAARTPEAFAEQLRRILDGTIDVGALSRRAASVIWRDFHLDTVIKRVETALERASKQSRSGAGSAAEAYHLAVLAEKLMSVQLQEDG